MSVSQVVSPVRTGDASGDRIQRYSLGERVNHWIGALFYIYCLVTGLAFWSPYMFWMVVLVGGGPAARFWHPWLGLVFFASVTWMYKLWLAIWPLPRRTAPGMRRLTTTSATKMKIFLRFGRFNWGQKLFFWLMLYGAILLLHLRLRTLVGGVDSVGACAGYVICRSSCTLLRRWLRSAASSFTSIWAQPWCVAGSRRSSAEKCRPPGPKLITACGTSRSGKGPPGGNDPK